MKKSTLGRRGKLRAVIILLIIGLIYYVFQVEFTVAQLTTQFETVLASVNQSVFRPNLNLFNIRNCSMPNSMLHKNYRDLTPPELLTLNLPRPELELIGEKKITFPKDNQNFKLIIGIPTVVRNNSTNYIFYTLHSLLTNLNQLELNFTKLVVLIGRKHNHDNQTANYIKLVSKSIIDRWSTFIDSGNLVIITSPEVYYSMFEKTLRPATYKDSLVRYRWRIRQNLDFAYLMNYCSKLGGTHYIHMEDDVQTSATYASHIKTFVNENPDNDKWLYLEFSTLGFIGKLLQTRDLPGIVSYFLHFYWLKPPDLLLYNLVHILCDPIKNGNCQTYKAVKLRRQYKISLFQHIGKKSSLMGNENKLVDSAFVNLTKQLIKL